MKKQVLEALNWRYATKKYNPAFQLGTNDKQQLEDIIQLSPSSYGLQPLHFIWIEDTKLREKVKSIAMNQQQIIEAAEVLILCAYNQLDAAYLNSHIDNLRDKRGLQEYQVANFRSHLLASIGTKSDDEILAWNDKQAYIVLGQLLTACALMHLDATPMEGFDPKALNELLSLDSLGLHSVLICTIGQRATDDNYQKLEKVRRDKKSLFSKR